MINQHQTDMWLYGCAGSLLLWLLGCQHASPPASTKTTAAAPEVLKRDLIWQTLHAHGIRSTQMGQELMLMAPTDHYFHGISTCLSAPGLQRLQQILAFLRRYPVHSISVISYPNGSDQKLRDHLALSRARVLARWLDQHLDAPLLLVERRSNWHHQAMWGAPLQPRVPHIALAINPLARRSDA